MPSFGKTNPLKKSDFAEFYLKLIQQKIDIKYKMKDFLYLQESKSPKKAIALI